MMSEKARVISADPPWAFGDKLPGEGRGAAKHYDVLEIHDIQRFPLPPIEQHAMLSLWRVSSQVEEAYSVVRAWGFKPKTEIVWVKLAKGSPSFTLKDIEDGKIDPKLIGQAFGMGHYLRNCHETAIVATRGSFKVKDKAVRTVFFAPMGEHSEKPDLYYELLEKLAGEGPLCELFGRKARAGWHVHGNEIPGGGYIWTPPDPTRATAAEVVKAINSNPVANGFGKDGVALAPTKPPPPPSEDDVDPFADADGVEDPPMVVRAEVTRGNGDDGWKIDGATPRHTIAVPMPPPVRGSKMVPALCGECMTPQYGSPGGPVCANGHGGADSIPEGEPEAPMNTNGDGRVKRLLTEGRYIVLAMMQGLMTQEEGAKADAYVRLHYKAPAGWFGKQDAYVADYVKRNPMTDPEKVPVTLQNLGSAVPAQENLSKLAGLLVAQGINITLPELAGLGPMQRDVANAWIEQGAEAENMPPFLEPFQHTKPPADVEIVPGATPAAETKPETPKAKGKRGRPKKVLEEGTTPPDVAHELATNGTKFPDVTITTKSNGKTNGNGAGDPWSLAKAACMRGNDPIVEEGFWT